jgi:transcriptional regulator with XRE-family HTH domain
VITPVDVEATVAADSSPAEDWPSPLAIQLAAEIRRWRQAAGFSEAHLAGVIGFTRQYISFAERPRRGLPSAALVKAIDDAVGAGGALVALRQQAYDEWQASRPGATSATASAERESHASADPAEVEATKRRELPASAAAITFGATLDQPVGTIIAAAEQPQVPTRVRPGDVRHVHSTAQWLEDWDYKAGGGAVRPHALAALRWATALREASCTPAVRLDLEAAVARLADTAAWVVFDCGDYAAARPLLLLGLHAARESCDLGLRGSITMHLALQEIHTGNWIGGLELTQLASTAAEAFTPNMMARLHTVNALGYARKHDAAQCHRSIEAATNTYQPDSLVNDPPWLQYFTPITLEGDLIKARYDLALGDAEVGDHTADRLVVIERLSTVFTQIPPERARAKAMTATRLATLLYQEGEHRAAQQTAEEAISLAEHIQSARLAADLQVLLQTMPPGNGRDGQDLHHRLSAVLTEMT